jgi:hypothetical protein
MTTAADAPRYWESAKPGDLKKGTPVPAANWLQPYRDRYRPERTEGQARQGLPAARAWPVTSSQPNLPQQAPQPITAALFLAASRTAN